MTAKLTAGTVSLLTERLKDNGFEIPENFAAQLDEMIHSQEKTDLYLKIEKICDLFPDLEGRMDPVSKELLEDFGLNVEALSNLSRILSPVNVIDEKTGKTIVTMTLGTPMGIPLKNSKYRWVRTRRTNDMFAFENLVFPEVVLNALPGKMFSEVVSHHVTDKYPIKIISYDSNNKSLNLKLAWK
jgi:hypothetical protein